MGGRSEYHLRRLRAKVGVKGCPGRQWLVLVMTPAALASPWVHREVNTALAELTAGRMHGVLPVEMTPCDISDIPLLWRTLHRYDAIHAYEPAKSDALFQALGLAASYTAPSALPSLAPSRSSTPIGQVSEFLLPAADGYPNGIAAGPDGALWFTEFEGHRIGRITTSGQIREFPLISSDGKPGGIAAGPDGALWFTEAGSHRIGRITTTGQISEFPLPPGRDSPHDIAAGPDGALWFTEYGNNRIGRISTGQ